MRLRIAAIMGLAALTAVSIAGVSASQPAPDPGALLFTGRCASCHDPAQGRAPSREALGQRSPESIVAALTTGVMRPFSSGLTPDMIKGVAVYLAGKPL